MDKKSHARATSDHWVRYDVAIRASDTPDWVQRVMDALESGQIMARIVGELGLSRTEISGIGGILPPDWWVKYRSDCVSDAPTQSCWTFWLDNAEVEAGPLLQLLAEHLRALRIQWGASRRANRPDWLWSELEALAWIASKDLELVSKVRDFGHQDIGRAFVARNLGFQYLRYHVAVNHCQCGMNRSLPSSGAPEICTCVIVAWRVLAAILRNGQLTGTLVADDGSEIPVVAVKTSIAPAAMGERFALLSKPGELLFDETDVLQASAQCHAPIQVDSKRRVGRPKGAGAKDDARHLKSMHDWLKRNPGNSPRDAAKVVDAEANKLGSVQSESFIRRLVRKYVASHYWDGI